MYFFNLVDWVDIYIIYKLIFVFEFFFLDSLIFCPLLSLSIQCTISQSQIWRLWYIFQYLVTLAADQIAVVLWRIYDFSFSDFIPNVSVIQTLNLTCWLWKFLLVFYRSYNKHMDWMINDMFMVLKCFTQEERMTFHLLKPILSY